MIPQLYSIRERWQRQNTMPCRFVRWKLFCLDFFVTFFIKEKSEEILFKKEPFSCTQKKSAGSRQGSEVQSQKPKVESLIGILPIISLLLSLMLIACTPKPIDIKIDPPKPKLVVSSQIIPGQIMVVALTRSFSALSSAAHADSANSYLDSIATKNALVTVSYNGQTDTLPMLIPGLYLSINTLQQNYGTYKLYAKDYEGGLEASATTTLLPAVKFDTIIPKVEKGAKDTIVKVAYTFTDLPGVENYYVVSYFLKRSGGSGVDVNNFFNRGSNQLSAIDLFSDKTFDKPSFTFTRDFIGVGIKPTDTVALVLSNISKGYYEFLSAYKRAGDWFNQLSGEPINYPTNVEGGYGYFNANYADYRIYYLKDY